MITGGREHPGVGPTAYARLGDPDDSARHAWGHTHCPLLVDLEGDQVALVDADEVGTDRDRPCQLGFVVHLDQRVETDRASKRMERLQLGVVERCRDEQHAIGAHQSCIAHVVRGHREVLAQHRPTARGLPSAITAMPSSVDASTSAARNPRAGGISCAASTSEPSERWSSAARARCVSRMRSR